MKPLVWSELYSVYNDDLDGHHQKILNLINRLEDESLVEITPRDYLREIIQDLVDYAENHFREEEEFMRNMNYPDFNEHKNQHDQFRHDVRVFQHDYNKDHEKVFTAIAHYLKNWFIAHILTSDKKYAAYFKKHGVQNRM